ncbi:DNA-binding response regulator [Zavarzinia compransoris]|uniref:DNA-binding response regulator n=1 Tax=Zavarzinia compransoris TaxID=1264899 RepID=A0A317E9U0_9PROT|nr:DNA-binding response regulator [Zavarzinia compransoris]PWR23084.1 DNA-binding response regulator [Zavarzinia compransoris]
MTARDIVLVVDDSPGTLGMLTDAIEEAGLTVLVAVAGQAALSLVEKITPDVILLDAVMPGMNGFETCRHLKRIPAIAHVPVIFMTGLSETEHIVSGFAAGGVDYVTKPIAPDELVARIRVHLANARLTQSARAALDATGRYLLGVDPAGRILWSTPQAARLLSADGGAGRLSAEAVHWVAQLAAGDNAPPRFTPPAIAGRKLQFGFVGRTGAQELLLQLAELDQPAQEIVLRDKLGLTAREGEVLMWLARGKSNRDIAEILGLSPRTVNKHLETIYDKLGVENRTAAAMLALRTLEGDRN